MNVMHVGMISTGTVIALGAFLVVPVFFPPNPRLPVLLTFDLIDNNNLPEWCNKLSSILKEHNLKAVVFVSGKIAYEYPQCVNDFSHDVDIGSQTFDNVSLPSLGEYSKELDEVMKGKYAVDAAGDLDSRLFKAPYNSVDVNIYSLLQKAGILADFSYSSQYNKYYDDKFITFDLDTYNGMTTSINFINELSSDKGPISITFNNFDSVEKINDVLLKLDSNKVKFVNASDLTGLDLTVRKWRFS